MRARIMAAAGAPLAGRTTVQKLLEIPSCGQSEHGDDVAVGAGTE